MIWYKIPVRFVFRTWFASAIFVRPATCASTIEYTLLSFSFKRAWQAVGSHCIRQHRGDLRQTTVKTSYWSRPGRSGGDEPGLEAIGGWVHKRHALNTQLSSGTSARTFAVSTDPSGPCVNYHAKAGTNLKNEPDMFFVPVQKKGWKSGRSTWMF